MATHQLSQILANLALAGFLEIKINFVGEARSRAFHVEFAHFKTGIN